MLKKNSEVGENLEMRRTAAKGIWDPKGTLYLYLYLGDFQLFYWVFPFLVAIFGCVAMKTVAVSMETT